MRGNRPEIAKSGHWRQPSFLVLLLLLSSREEYPQEDTMSDIARLIPRLSTTERLILDLLREGELFGLQLVDRSDGALKRGTVYVTLGRMQDKGYVESRTEPLPPGAIGLPRR